MKGADMKPCCFIPLVIPNIRERYCAMFSPKYSWRTACIIVLLKFATIGEGTLQLPNKAKGGAFPEGWCVVKA